MCSCLVHHSAGPESIPVVASSHRISDIHNAIRCKSFSVWITIYSAAWACICCTAGRIKMSSQPMLAGEKTSKPSPAEGWKSTSTSDWLPEQRTPPPHARLVPCAINFSLVAVRRSPLNSAHLTSPHLRCGAVELEQAGNKTAQRYLLRRRTDGDAHLRVPAYIIYRSAVKPTWWRAAHGHPNHRRRRQDT